MQKFRSGCLILFLKLFSTFSIGSNRNSFVLQQPQGEMGRKGGGQTPIRKPRSQELFRLEDVPMQWSQHRRLVRLFSGLN